MKKVTIYTDGACSGNPGPGGFGVVCLNTCYSQTMMEYIPRHTLNYCYAEYSENTTNNREELKAILHVIKMAAAHPEIDFIVYSDSAYCVNTFNEWMFNWARKGWIKSDKQVPENLDLIQAYYDWYKEGYRIDLRKVKGHNNNKWNEMADQLATGQIKSTGGLI